MTLSMKTLALTSTLMLFSAVASASVTFNLAVGPLLDQNGNAIPEGSLIQLIYLTGSKTTLSTDPLLPGSFVHEDEVVFCQFGMDSSLSGADIGGYSESSVVINFEDAGLTAGAQLAFRWFPTLEVGDTPVAGDAYGQSNPLYLVGGVNNGDSWIAPGDGGWKDIVYMDNGIDFGGLVPTTELRATYQVIPEPSTYALGGVGLLGALVALRRRRRV